LEGWKDGETATFSAFHPSNLSTAYDADSLPEGEGPTMNSIQRDWDWWAYHFRVVHREQIPGIAQWDDELVDMIVEVLGLRPGDRVLDLACGSGVHALRLAQRGLDVLGIDVAPGLVAHDRAQAAELGIGGVRFEQGDMRALDYDAQFQAILLLSGSFGFFDEATNEDVLARIARALRPGGRVLIDVFDPTHMVVRPPRRSWFRLAGGISMSHTWWEPETCTYVNEFSYIDPDGTLNTAAEPERIRVYSLPEWRAMLAQVGLTLTHALADTRLPLVQYDRDHYGNLVIAAEKR
jgi:SAM-dependent methyltransferase